MDHLTHENKITIRYLNTSNREAWDQYVQNHPRSSPYHLSGWKDIIENSYGHKAYYLIAIQESKSDSEHYQKATITKSSCTVKLNQKERIVGILPLIHLKHFIFGNNLISMPYVDTGGALTNNSDIENRLILEAEKISQNLKVESIELRNSSKLHGFDLNNSEKYISVQSFSNKVSMILALPESSEILMKSFKSKLRSQIRKPMKENLISKIGGIELLDHYFDVFATNMRDLGSPVHSKKLLRNVLEEFQDTARIIMIYRGEIPLAGGIVIGFNDILYNPWASSLRKYRKLCPNMLLYWQMLKYACDSGFKNFDFGRSTPGEGTYRFKKQWGAIPFNLEWYYINFTNHSKNNNNSLHTKYKFFMRLWQNSPVFITRLIGPGIRKNIGL